MTGRIFRSIFFTSLAVFAASVVLFMWVLYDHFSGVQKEQLRMQTSLAAHGAANEGAEYFKELETKGFRVTWISADGTVLFDSKTDSADMENHLEREEIKEALDSGFGEGQRYSATLTERLFYCAERLPDGTVIRLSVAQNSMLTLILAMTQPILVIFASAFILSLVFASRLSKRIVKPLNGLNLDEPLNNDSYDEIAPLLTRLSSQQQRIKTQSDELEQKRREFEAVTTGMTEGIVLLNAKHEILSINPSAKKLLGAESVSSEQPFPAGQTILSLNRSTELQEVLAQADKGSRAERVAAFSNGSYEISASPIITDEKVSGMALLFLNVTEKERSEQLRREFTANVSHELKTPLQTISGYAELMSNGMAKAEDLTDFSGKIYAESRRMIRLVDDIIKLSRLDEGTGELLFESVDLYAIAAETASELQDLAEGVGVSLAVTGEPTVMSGIPRLLREIVFNLCDNAVKYNRSGGRVTITVSRDENAAKLSVSDTGIGIPEEHIKRIFERFYRVDKSRSKAVSGTGLGLSIVKHAALAHGAGIETHSEPNVGTVITVSFPI